MESLLALLLASILALNLMRGGMREGKQALASQHRQYRQRRCWQSDCLVRALMKMCRCGDGGGGLRGEAEEGRGEEESTVGEEEEEEEKEEEGGKELEEEGVKEMLRLPPLTFAPSATVSRKSWMRCKPMWYASRSQR